MVETENQKPLIGVAPMAGYTNSPFRRIIREICSDAIIMTELLSVDAIFFKSKKTARMMRFHESERPLILQLFGHSTERFVHAAKVAEDMGFAGIDINMGCPAKKVVRSENGSALIRNPKKAYEIVQHVVEATSLPVSVKTRIGWADNSELLTFCTGLYEQGISLLTIHGRMVTQYHNGEPDWEPIYRVQEALPIPVLGNGGVKNHQDGLNKTKNLAGFLIGRAVIGNPWVLNDTTPTITEKQDVMCRHVAYMVEYFGERIGILEFRKHAAEYIKDFPNAKYIRNKIMAADTLHEVQEVIHNEMLY